MCNSRQWWLFPAGASIHCISTSATSYGNWMAKASQAVSGLGVAAIPFPSAHQWRLWHEQLCPNPGECRQFRFPFPPTHPSLNWQIRFGKKSCNCHGIVQNKEAGAIHVINFDCIFLWFPISKVFMQGGNTFATSLHTCPLSPASQPSLLQTVLMLRRLEAFAVSVQPNAPFDMIHGGYSHFLSPQCTFGQTLGGAGGRRKNREFAAATVSIGTEGLWFTSRMYVWSLKCR